MYSNQRIIKNIFIIYSCMIVSISLFIKFYFKIIDDDGLQKAFELYIPNKILIIIVSFIVGLLIYQFGFNNRNDKLYRKIIGYLSFGGATVFMNFIFCFILLIIINNFQNQQPEVFELKGIVIEKEQYKFSKTIVVKAYNSNENYNLSVNKDYKIGEEVNLQLKKGKLDFYYW